MRLRCRWRRRTAVPRSVRRLRFIPAAAAACVGARADPPANRRLGRPTGPGLPLGSRARLGGDVMPHSVSVPFTKKFGEGRGAAGGVAGCAGKPLTPRGRGSPPFPRGIAHAWRPLQQRNRIAERGRSLPGISPSGAALPTRLAAAAASTQSPVVPSRSPGVPTAAAVGRAGVPHGR